MQDNFFSRIVKKNYNNKLEKVLEDKSFNETSKNLLLGILYKIEAAYKDYETVKRDTLSQEEYINKVIDIIKNNCDRLIILNQGEETLKNKTFTIDKEKKEIISYPIERKLLYAISKLNNKDVIITDKYDFISDVLSNSINIGNNMDTVETLRDFNGWSWSTVNKELESIEYNLLYQNMRILIGNNALQKIVSNDKKPEDSLKFLGQKLKSKMGEQNTLYFLDSLKRISILLEIKYNEDSKDKLNKIRLEEEKTYKKLQNKDKYFEQLANEKIKNEKRINQIRETLDDEDKIKKEYERRNKKLPLEKKIFSIRILLKMLIDERNELIKRTKEIKRLSTQEEYELNLKEVQEKLRYLRLVNTRGKEDLTRELLVIMQKIFLQGMNGKINQANTKEGIIDLIYHFRYYCMLHFNMEEQIFEVEELQEEINSVGKFLLEKAIALKIINTFSKNLDLNYEILQNIYKTRIISLEELNIKITSENDKFYIQLFDENIFDEKIELKINRKIIKKDFSVRLNKKIKLFN